MNIVVAFAGFAMLATIVLHPSIALNLGSMIVATVKNAMALGSPKPAAQPGPPQAYTSNGNLNA